MVTGPMRPSSEIQREEATSVFESLKLPHDNAKWNPNLEVFAIALTSNTWEKCRQNQWGREALGNIVFRKLVVCPCRDYGQFRLIPRLHAEE